jgi:dipeptidyl aminopeptidase/acylaminoacyl peptidase
LIGVLLCLAALVAVPAVIDVRSYRAQRLDFAPDAPEALLSHPEATGIPGLRSVWIPRRDGARVSAWFAPPANGATIVLLHGTNADRTSLLWEARVLQRAGFGVVAVDWPGHGLSDGKVQWGAEERAALKATVDWLAAQPTADPERIGAIGFSNGGYILAQVAAVDPRLRAVVLAATPPSLVEQSGWAFRRYGPLSRGAALLGLRRSGVVIDHEQAPMQLVGAIAPRPVLLIGGTDDQTVPAYMVRELYRQAREPRELWIVNGATHGHYDRSAPVEYERRLVQFFSTALLD